MSDFASSQSLQEKWIGINTTYIRNVYHMRQGKNFSQYYVHLEGKGVLHEVKEFRDTHGKVANTKVIKETNTTVLKFRLTI